MRAFHGKQEVKDFYLARVIAHEQADEIIQGVYWERGRGCAVGCTIHSNNHADYELLMGIPRQIARLQDRLFEGLPLSEAKSFPRAFIKAIPVGADLSWVIPRFLHWLLVDPIDGVIRFAQTEQQRVLIQRVARLYQRLLHGEDVPGEEWKSADAAANADAADTAAAAAAYAYAAAANADVYPIMREQLLALLQAAPVCSEIS